MKELKNYSIEDLEKAIEEKKRQQKTIQPVENPDFSDLIQTVKEQVEGTIKGEEPKDGEHWIYEAAMTAVYGDNIFEKLKDFY